MRQQSPLIQILTLLTRTSPNRRIPDRIVMRKALQKKQGEYQAIGIHCTRSSKRRSLYNFLCILVQNWRRTAHRPSKWKIKLPLNYFFSCTISILFHRFILVLSLLTNKLLTNVFYLNSFWSSSISIKV
ncbi:hypothetical protein D9M72_602770 [compost metagenome]